MRPAQIIVLLTAVAAGGGAMVLMGRSEAPLPAVKVANIETSDVLVAKNDIGIGHTLQAADVQWQTWPKTSLNSQFMKRSDDPNAADKVAGAIARVSFASGEPIRESKVIRADGSGYMAAIVQPGKRAIAIEISPETGVGGFVLPNDHVDVLLTRSERTVNNQEVFSSETILSDVRVLAIDQTVEEKNGQKVVVGKIATLELTPRRAETLALARRLGTISIMLRGLREKSPRLAGENDEERLGNTEKVSVVRFGITTAVTSK
ncbi:MAG: Flp pilus assembly protein CpaB [Proteobacteria bacterium]|nr:Flp pilus assembly protein CpaB [Pseudomonadota bacterium]